MLLLREELFAESEEANNFLGKLLSLFKAFGVQQNLCNELIIGNGHGDRSKKLLQVIR